MAHFAPTFVGDADLDALGHVHGPGSEAWRWQLRFVDRLAAAVAEGLPAGAALVVTADHGMVAADDRVDFDTDDVLRDGVRVLGGEARVRHVYTSAVEAVRARWVERLGDRAWIASFLPSGVVDPSFTSTVQSAGGVYPERSSLKLPELLLVVIWTPSTVMGRPAIALPSALPRL